MILGHWLRVIRNHPRPVRLIAARVLEWSGCSQLFTVPLDGYRLRLYPSNATLNLWINPQSRMHGLELFRDYCSAGDMVVDVGANVGEVSIIMSQQVGAAGRVVAFEPSPRIYRYLQGNLALNRCANVTTRNVALAAKPGQLMLSDDRRDDMNHLVTAGGVTVECSTIDLELTGDGPLALLKIDVEGAELFVLQGAMRWLARTECVNCEMWESHFRRYGYGMADLIGFLADRGFETFVIDGARRLRPVDAAFADPGGHELVAVRARDAFLRRTGWQVA
jgi:FkbM family methyltransferase